MFVTELILVFFSGLALWGIGVSHVILHVYPWIYPFSVFPTHFKPTIDFITFISTNQVAHFKTWVVNMLLSLFNIDFMSKHHVK